MPRGDNAQLAVEMYRELRKKYRWSAADAWKAVAILLLSCDVWKEKGWKPLYGSIVYRESNDFKMLKTGPNGYLRKAMQLSEYLASLLPCRREELCSSVGTYWRHPDVSSLQPHNLVGHAFRSLITEILRDYGNGAITYEEEIDPRAEFHGYAFQTRSKRSRIDIIARRSNIPVALISTRWRFRHDRVDVVDEAYAYVNAARRINANCEFHAVLGEFSSARLHKVLMNAAPESNPGIITAAVHFNPELVSRGLGENGRVEHLKSLEWLIEQSSKW